MQSYSTLQQLIEYCSTCPVCFKERYTDITFGPDTSTKIDKFEFGYRLKLLVVTKINVSRYKILFEINTQDNTFKLHIPKFTTENQKYALSIDIDSRPEFYFHLYSTCKTCGQSQVNTSDMVFDFKNKIIANIGVESEVRILHDNEMVFDLEYDWEANQIEIFRHKDGDWSEKDLPDFYLPMSDLNFSDPEKLVIKLKTLHMFS